jgi:hypothetical protein
MSTKAIAATTTHESSASGSAAYARYSPDPPRDARRAAIEPVIGHIKAEQRLGRNYLKGRDGNRINAVLAAAGYNFSPFLRWLERLLRA